MTPCSATAHCWMRCWRSQSSSTAHFVETIKGIRLCRPSEGVLDLLPPVSRPFSKEDGTVVIDQGGHRIS